MGSLYSKPKMPDPYTPVYTTSPAAATPVATQTSNEPANADQEKAAAIVRKRTLPQTILTSFRGVLSQGDWMPSRKSLLGE